MLDPYEVCAFETRIAARLRDASRTERMKLYNEVYDEFFLAFPDLLRTEDPDPTRRFGYELAFAKRFVTPDSVVAEIGPGQCELALALAPSCKCIYGVDVTDLSPKAASPANFKHVLTDGIGIPLPDNSVDVAISNQLMEHLHPDDAADQVKEVYRVMRPGGSYICITPNRLYGPHDSSVLNEPSCPIVDGAFVANGLHLKEYTHLELHQLFLATGFRRTRHFAGARGRYMELPLVGMIVGERCVRYIPPKLRIRSNILRILLGARVVAEK
jgi:ubiquinone/menaquinone biosynthesis C-methylase UbiE